MSEELVKALTDLVNAIARLAQITGTGAFAFIVLGLTALLVGIPWLREHRIDIRQLNVYPRTTSSRPCPVSLKPALERSIGEHVAWRVVAERGMPTEQSTARHRRIWFLWDGQEYRADAAGWQDVPESEVTGEQ